MKCVNPDLKSQWSQAKVLIFLCTALTWRVTFRWWYDCGKK
jgi:hypothetical protein